MKKRIVFLLLILSPLPCVSQTNPTGDRPKLVVGIVVDQMREEYLYRFADKFGSNGFQRLMSDGFMLRNAHYNYVPTYTGPGHASVYTGTTPAIHGIIGNDYYDKQIRKVVNCVEDSRFQPVGSKDGNGDVSPARLLSSTITDELKLSSQMRSRVVGVSIKDRGAVLPAGHLPDGAYWYDALTGKFITSTYYKKELPSWVNKFNVRNLADKYLSQDWNTVLPILSYTESGPDDNLYEGVFKSKDKPVFPYNLKELRKANNNFEMLPFTPFGNDLLTEMAKAAIDGEGLGEDATTDFLTISFSSPDVIGHMMGPNSVELEDLYIRLDRNIADILTTLDKKTGAGNYCVFLTADHAVADVPQYLKDNSIPAGILKMQQIEAAATSILTLSQPGKKIIENMSNNQIFFNQDLYSTNLKTAAEDFRNATGVLVQYLQGINGIAQVYTADVVKASDYGDKGIKGMIARGYNHKRSGEIIFVTEPGWLSYSGSKGTTHGSPYNYDTNVPVLFYGWGIKKGSSVQYHTTTDIAPTLSILLKIKFPGGCTGQPIQEIIDSDIK
jgi:predicted AlkP superfamily pyrophosphatase or phosphodiesterase